MVFLPLGRNEGPSSAGDESGCLGWAYGSSKSGLFSIGYCGNLSKSFNSGSSSEGNGGNSGSVKSSAPLGIISSSLISPSGSLEVCSVPNGGIGGTSKLSSVSLFFKNFKNATV